MRILIANDGSECSDRALAEALRLLPMTAARVSVMAVADLAVAMPGFEVGSGSATLLFDRIEQDTEASLARAVKWLAARGVAAEAILGKGRPADEILSVAAELAPDVIVMGSHGRNAVGRLMMGSVSDAVLRHWHGNTLVVRA